MTNLAKLALVQGVKYQFKQNLLFVFRGSVFDSGMLVESQVLFDSDAQGALVLDVQGLPFAVELEEMPKFKALVQETYNSALTRYYLAYQNAISNAG